MPWNTFAAGTATDAYAMSQDYAAIITSVLGALLLVSVVEASNAFRARGDAQRKLLTMFAEELSESASALRSGTDIPEARRARVKSRVRVYIRLRKRMERVAKVLNIGWTVIFIANFMTLMKVITWSALEKGGTASGIAEYSWILSALIIYAMLAAFLLRTFSMRALDGWEVRLSVADRMGTTPTRMSHVMRRWERHHGLRP
ncbi:hypothetical protein [Streptomyces sp. NPDC090057]|uniref:hypothetical protein n=1 Tax=Streptomyces sp. NPDC090057 TaxID=3365935 RepID=UPI003822740A